MRAYVTGAGGMVGSYLVTRLKQIGMEVEGSYFHPTTDIKEIDSSIPLFELDVLNTKAMESYILEKKPERIFHLAAQSFPVVSWKDPYYTMDVNVKGTVGLFEAIKEARSLDPTYDPMVVVISSSAIYGEALLSYSKDNLPKEDCPMLPLHPYGVSKAAEDLLCFQYFRNFGIRTARVRLFNCTGPKKIGDITSDFTKRAVELEKSGGHELKVGNLTALRAILDVRDLCEALILLGEKGEAGEAYNISSSHIFKMSHVVECIEQYTGTKFTLVPDKSLFRPADERLYAGDCTKIKALGWEEKYTYAQTVADMVDYWRKKLS